MAVEDEIEIVLRIINNWGISMEFNEKTLSETRAYSGKIIKVRVDEVQLQDGRMTVREVCEHPGGVAVLPLTSGGDVVLVKQYRYPYRVELLEVPAGKLEPGEDPLECGVRELKEETGLTAGRIQPLGVMYPSPGYLNEKLYLYLARDLSAGDASPDEGEYLRVECMPFEELIGLIMDDQIHDGKTVVSALKTAKILEQESQAG